MELRDIILLAALVAAVLLGFFVMLLLGRFQQERQGRGTRKRHRKQDYTVAVPHPAEGNTPADSAPAETAEAKEGETNPPKDGEKG